MKCIGCNQDNLQDGDGSFYFIMDCPRCQTRMLIEKETNELDSYYYTYKYKSNNYTACFQIKEAKGIEPFSLEYMELDRDGNKKYGSWSIVFTLNYLPKLTIQQFIDKLPIWLLLS